MYQSLFGALNLGIHEAGHFIFAPFGEFLEILGGSLAQCLAPVIAMYLFYRRRDYFAIAICFGWLSTNFFGVATYAGDARSMALPLVTPGGGPAQHDWFNLLLRLDMLMWDKTLAFIFRCAAFVSMLVCLAGGAYLIYRMIKPVEDKEPTSVEYKSKIS